jgi:hypothetical protein
MDKRVVSAKASLRERPLICFSHLRWNFVFQRPQHLLTRAAGSFTVYFFEEPIFAGVEAPHLRREMSPEGVTVLVPVLPEGCSPSQAARAQRALVDTLVEDFIDPPTLWYYTPMALPFSRHLRADLLVYDNMGQLSAFRGAPPRLVDLERELFKRADVVFCGGQRLYEAKRKRHHNVHAFPSSIDVAHFAGARREEVHLPDQEAIPHPRLGFGGAAARLALRADRTGREDRSGRPAAVRQHPLAGRQELPGAAGLPIRLGRRHHAFRHQRSDPLHQSNEDA